eukprot:scaffold207611_cov48-Prasinocladus_malaysianus.AAC.2
MERILTHSKSVKQFNDNVIRKIATASTLMSLHYQVSIANVACWISFHDVGGLHCFHQSISQSAIGFRL